jgi:hypothetical protein
VTGHDGPVWEDEEGERQNSGIVEAPGKRASRKSRYFRKLVGKACDLREFDRSARGLIDRKLAESHGNAA